MWRFGLQGGAPNNSFKPKPNRYAIGFGLILALGRTKRCKGLAAPALFLLHDFGGLLVRGVGSVIALRGVLVQLCRACAS